MRNLLKLCYICLSFFLISCGKGEQKQDVDQNNAVDETNQEPAQADRKVILFFGNSLTAGMGLKEEEAFPAIIQKKLDSIADNFYVVNAGLSGETTASGKNRLEWVLNQKVDIFVLELGANDGLRGISIEETRRNLQEIIDKVRAHNKDTKILITGMQIPPNMGQAYTSEFRAIFPEISRENNIGLVPFLLKDVAGVPDLNQADGIHPTAEGQLILAENVWKELQALVLE